MAGVLGGLGGLGARALALGGRFLPRVFTGAAPTVAAEGAEIAATTATRSPGWLSRLWNTPLTTGRLLVGSTAVTGATFALTAGYAQIDKAYGGALSMWLADRAVQGVIGGYEEATKAMTDPAKRQWISEKIKTIDSVRSLISTDVVDTFGMNNVVKMKLDAGPEAQKNEAAKNAAIAWQFHNPALLTAKTVVRAAIFSQVYPEKTSAEINKMLAEDLIDDVIAGTKCSVLTDAKIEVTREDVHEQIEEHADIINKIPGFDSMREGLVAVYPELASKLDTGQGVPAPVVDVSAPATSDAVPSTVRSLADSALNTGHEVVAQKTGLSAVFKWVSELFEVIENAFDVLFKGGSPASYFNQHAVRTHVTPDQVNQNKKNLPGFEL